MTFLNDFGSRYGALLGSRAPTMQAFFEAIYLKGPAHRNIVETGCLRQVGNYSGDGQSTKLLNEFARTTKATIWSVDIDPAAIQTAASVVGTNNNTVLILNNSVNFLHRFNDKIHGLYLDSFDLDKEDPLPAATHHLLELCAASRTLVQGAIVLVDDTWRENGVIKGKGQLVAKYMMAIGATLIASGYQDVWKVP